MNDNNKPMPLDTYMLERVDHQIKWHSDNSVSSQQSFKRLRAWEIILAAAIPVITTAAALCVEWMGLGTLLVAVFGGAIAVLTGLSGMDRHHELWINYRTTCESLKKEKYFFLTQAAPYDGEDAYPLFVERIESLLSKENTNWSKLIEQQTTSQPKSGT